MLPRQRRAMSGAAPQVAGVVARARVEAIRELLDTSSTIVRAMTTDEALSADPAYLDPKVAEYMRSHGLYMFKDSL